MPKLLYLESSPRKQRSSSIEVANVFLDEYKKRHPKDEILIIDLWKKPLPPFDGDAIDAKYAILHQQNFTEKQKAAWKAVEDVIGEFKSADKYVISLPMWNFGIPYPLKHYLDIIAQPGYTFAYSPETGYQGLVTGKKALLIYSRGGAYGAQSGAQNLDHQKSYMEVMLPFIGFKEIQSIIIEPTLATAEQKDKTVKQARATALKLASEF